MKIADISTVIIEGESLSNVVRTNNRIHKEQGWDSTLIAEHYSSFDFVLPYAIKDYFETKTLDPFREFIHSKKSEWFRMALPSKVRYKPKAAYNAIEKANIRVWHLGAFYPLFEHFHRNDIFFFYGITYPFLSHDTNHAFYSYSMMQTIKSLDPRIITISEFIKSDLIKQGFDPGAIRVLPLFHTYNLPYRTYKPYIRSRGVHTYNYSSASDVATGKMQNRQKPQLLAYGRYAKNKAVPELAKICNEAGIGLTHFGENKMMKEFRKEYMSARKYANDNIRILPKQVAIENFFEDSDIYVCNSYHEGFNMPLVEAEAHSIPILARRGTAMDDLVKDGYNGFLFDSADEIPELSERIMRNYSSFSRNAWKHSNNFAYEKYKGRYLHVLKDLKREQFKS